MSTVRSSAGVLITCDVPTKMFIMNLDSKKKCVISDLDATHVFVKADSLPEIRKELEELHDRNVYVRPR